MGAPADDDEDSGEAVTATEREEAPSARVAPERCPTCGDRWCEQFVRTDHSDSHATRKPTPNWRKR